MGDGWGWAWGCDVWPEERFPTLKVHMKVDAWQSATVPHNCGQDCGSETRVLSVSHSCLGRMPSFSFPHQAYDPSYAPPQWKVCSPCNFPSSFRLSSIESLRDLKIFGCASVALVYCRSNLSLLLLGNRGRRNAKRRRRYSREK